MKAAETPPAPESVDRERACRRALVVERLPEWIARLAWSTFSALAVAVCGLCTGLSALDGSRFAAWLRATTLVFMLGLLAFIARRVGCSLAKATDRRESASGALLPRGKVVGPPRRWAIWLTTAATSCIVAFLLNETRGDVAGTLTRLVPKRWTEIAALAIGMAVLIPYLLDLGDGRRPLRRWPWSPPSQARRGLREHADVIGWVSRLSPPLLLGFLIPIGMIIASYVVGVHEPMKGLAGAGVTAVFLGALLAAPALLSSPAEAMETAWRSHWYPLQRRIASELRDVLYCTDRLAAGAQIILLGVALGSIFSGSPAAATSAGHLAALAALTGLLRLLPKRMLWAWHPRPADAEPIGAEIIARYERKLIGVAGVALAIGSICSLVAILAS